MDEEAQNDFKLALDARNYVIHRFLTDQDQNLLTTKGRAEAISILTEKRKLIFDCYIIILSLIEQVMKLKGIDSTKIWKPVEIE